MSHLSYEDSIKRVYFGLGLLAAVTVIEVLFSLLAKGHLIKGLEDLSWLGYLVAVLLIGFSLYKATFIIFDFMHMKYEVRGMAWSVLLPVSLLIWGIIAFFQEGNSWKNRRLNNGNTEKVKTAEPAAPQGMLLEEDIYDLRQKG